MESSYFSVKVTRRYDGMAAVIPAVKVHTRVTEGSRDDGSRDLKLHGTLRAGAVGLEFRDGECKHYGFIVDSPVEIDRETYLMMLELLPELPF